MLLARDLYGASVDTADGQLGKIIDILFDDRGWQVKLISLDFRRWLRRRRVTIPHELIETKSWHERRVSITGLTRQQVFNSPRSEIHIPVRAHHLATAEATVMDWDTYLVKTSFTDHPWQLTDDPHVRSTHEIVGYRGHGSDGPIGRVVDFLVDDETWTVCQLVVDTGIWWTGRRVLVPAEHIEEIIGANRIVRLSLSREAIRQSPILNRPIHCKNPGVLRHRASGSV